MAADVAPADHWGESVDWLRAASQHFHGFAVAAVAGACRALLRRGGVRAMQRRTGIGAVPAQLAGRGVTAREFQGAHAARRAARRPGDARPGPEDGTMAGMTITSEADAA
jgi:hypothetical protein